MLAGCFQEVARATELPERGVLWDIAAGQLLVETAGGKVDLTPVAGYADAWSIVASNGRIPVDEIL